MVAKTFPLDKLHAALAATKRESVRQRDLPGHVTVYYVIALALYMQSSYREVLRCLLEGIQWLVTLVSRGANQAGLGAFAASARPGSEADCSGGDQGRMVSLMASGEYGREHAGYRRREGQ